MLNCLVYKCQGYICINNKPICLIGDNTELENSIINEIPDVKDGKYVDDTSKNVFNRGFTCEIPYTEKLQDIYNMF